MLKLIREFPNYFEYNAEYLTIVAYSFVGFLTVFRFLAPNVSAKISKSYDRLTLNQKIEWNSRLTSTLFSCIVSFICLYTLLVDRGLATSPLIYDSELVKINISIVMGYVLYDMVIIIVHYRVIGDVFTLFHHCISLFAYSYALTFSVMPYFANFRLIVELSTPLVNMRWFLYACSYPKDSLKFFVNGISMTLVFFLVRILTIPAYWYKVYTVLDSPQWSKLKYFRHIMILTCICLDVINIYWFKKMFKGALVVWSTNWTYYEKYHKPQQLEKLSSYHRSLKTKFMSANSALYQSTRNGLTLISNPIKYIGMGFLDKIFDYSAKIFSDVFPYNNTKATHHISATMADGDGHRKLIIDDDNDDVGGDDDDADINETFKRPLRSYTRSRM